MGQAQLESSPCLSPRRTPKPAPHGWGLTFSGPSCPAYHQTEPNFTPTQPDLYSPRLCPLPGIPLGQRPFCFLPKQELTGNVFFLKMHFLLVVEGMFYYFPHMPAFAYSGPLSSVNPFPSFMHLVNSCSFFKVPALGIPASHPCTSCPQTQLLRHPGLYLGPPALQFSLPTRGWWHLCPALSLP